MKHLLCIILLGLTLSIRCQQTGQFTQFTFNKYGYNPAAAGTNINNNLELIIGGRKQWIGLNRAPTSNFLSVNYTIKPERSYKHWHNFGFYLANESAGIYRNDSYYLSYTIHLPLNKKTYLSFGIFGGLKNFSVDKASISKSDPVFAATYDDYFLAYPDFIPGMRLYSKKKFLDVSVKQLYKNRQVQGNKQIGHKSLLVPQLYVSFGNKYLLNNGFLFVPAFNIHTSFTNIPSVELNMMTYYLRRLGLGISIRNKDFVSGILQVRFLKNMTFGLSYDYSINQLNQVAPNTIEFMIGLTPLMNFMGIDNEQYNITKCPSFDF